MKRLRRALRLILLGNSITKCLNPFISESISNQSAAHIWAMLVLGQKLARFRNQFRKKPDMEHCIKYSSLNVQINAWYAKLLHFDISLSHMAAIAWAEKFLKFFEKGSSGVHCMMFFCKERQKTTSLTTVMGIVMSLTYPDRLSKTMASCAIKCNG